MLHHRNLNTIYYIGSAFREVEEASFLGERHDWSAVETECWQSLSSRTAPHWCGDIDLGFWKGARLWLLEVVIIGIANERRKALASKYNYLHEFDICDAMRQCDEAMMQEGNRKDTGWSAKQIKHHTKIGLGWRDFRCGFWFRCLGTIAPILDIAVTWCLRRINRLLCDVIAMIPVLPTRFIYAENMLLLAI